MCSSKELRVLILIEIQTMKRRKSSLLVTVRTRKFATDVCNIRKFKLISYRVPVVKLSTSARVTGRP